MRDGKERRDAFDLDGRRALLTGSYRGLGQVLARGLAEAGAVVVLNGRSREPLEAEVARLRGEGLEAHGFAFDITRERQVDEAVGAIEREVGPLDILVNNAGVQKRAPLHEASTEDWRAIVDTHMTGAFLVSRRVAGGMIERGGGKIINVCSTASFAGRAGIGPYTAAKGGLLMLIRAMCADWGRSGCRRASPAQKPRLHRVDGRPHVGLAEAQVGAGRLGGGRELAAEHLPPVHAPPAGSSRGVHQLRSLPVAGIGQKAVGRKRGHPLGIQGGGAGYGADDHLARPGMAPDRLPAAGAHPPGGRHVGLEP